MKSYEYKSLANQFAHLAQQLVPEMTDVGVITLRSHAEKYLWHLGTVVNARQGSVDLRSIAPGFGLLVCKSPSWAPVENLDTPLPMTETEQDALCGFVARIGELVLPTDGKPGAYHHFSTEDGLICAFYRDDDREVILRAAGVDSSTPETLILH